jgi:hypothetical protein
LLTTTPDNQIDHDISYYSGFGVKDADTYINAMTEIKDGEKFFGDAQIVANAFARMNNINVNVYEPAEWTLPGEQPGSVITIKEPENYRKSYPDTVLFPNKPFLHIYHGGRIHYQAMIPNTESSPLLQLPQAAAAAEAQPQPQPQPQPQAQPPPFPGDRPPSTFETISLGPNPYNLPVGASDDKYRTQVFARLKAVPVEYDQLIVLLTEDERAILQDMGFLKQQFLIDFAQYMADFFQTLPHCTTETSVMLHRQCDTSYFLIFALLHSAAQEANEQMTQGEFVGDDELLRKRATANFFQKRLQPGKELDGVRKFVLKLTKLKNPNKPSVGSLLSSYVNMKKNTSQVNSEAIVNELFTLRI